MNRFCMRFALLSIFLGTLGFLEPTTAGAQENLFVKNTANYVSGRYVWTIYLGGDETTLTNIKHVEYTLHFSFPKPVQVIRERGGKCAFALTSNSWGEFEVKVKVVLKGGQERELKHWLSLLENKTTSSVCTSVPRKAARRRTRD